MSHVCVSSYLPWALFAETFIDRKETQITLTKNSRLDRGQVTYHLTILKNRAEIDHGRVPEFAPRCCVKAPCDDATNAGEGDDGVISSASKGVVRNTCYGYYNGPFDCFFYGISYCSTILVCDDQL